MEPILVTLREGVTGPEHPVSKAGQLRLRCGNRLLDFSPPRGADGAAAREAIPPALPAVPAARLAERTRRMQPQMELDTRLIGEGVKIAESAVVAAHERPAQHFEVCLRRTG